MSQVGSNGHGYVLQDVWRDSVINNATATFPNLPRQTTTFWHQDGGLTPLTLSGFGAIFDTSPGQGVHASGVTLILDVGGEVFNVTGFEGGFFGYYVTEPNEEFTTVTLDTQVSCLDGLPHCTGWEIFNMDNLQFALEGPIREIQATPEPATFGMIGAALAGLGLIRSRRRKA